MINLFIYVLGKNTCSKVDLKLMLISSFRGRSYKRLLEYLFFMWDPSLLNGNSEPIRVLEEGFRSAAVYEVCPLKFYNLNLSRQ